MRDRMRERKKERKKERKRVRNRERGGYNRKRKKCITWIGVKKR